MNKYLLVLINLIMVSLLMAYVIFHGIDESREHLEHQISSFENTTIAMQHVMANFHRGQQRLCNSWANYINEEHMTIDEAMEYLREAEPENEMTQIVFLDDGMYSGYSTEAVDKTSRNFTVSYAHMSVIQSLSLDPYIDTTVNMTRNYANPINGVMSVAFYHPVRIATHERDSSRSAVLLRLITLDRLNQEWQFLSDRYRESEIALTDNEGNFITKGASFKGTSFIEFYRMYNEGDVNEITAEITKWGTGSIRMKNAEGVECVISYTPMNSFHNRELLAYIPLRDLRSMPVSVSLIAVMMVGLLSILVFNVVMIRRNYRQIVISENKAKKAIADKAGFLSTMSHDIRTPLNVIVGVSAIVRSQVDNHELVEDGLRQIGLSGNNLTTMLTDILDIAEIERHHLVLNPAPFSIVECASNLTNMAQKTIKEKNQTCNFFIQHIDHEVFYGDQVRVNQIFSNLLSNALKFTPPGGQIDVSMWEEISENPKEVILNYRVSDNGPGMSEEFMTRMYDSFVTQKDGRVEKEKGTGVGLSIAKQLTDLMKGTITCESQVGKGTTFTVSLPLPYVNENVDNMTLPSTRVLLVDDNKILRTSARETLYLVGVMADTAASGGEAIEKVLTEHAEGEDYDFVIIDWRMPGMDGIETARRIKQSLGDKSPKVLIAAYDWTNFRRDARRVGVDGFISKPLFRSTLYRKLADLLGEKRMSEVEADSLSLEGMHILVTEDNDVNWNIISMILETYGITTERAENGLKAVERMARAKEGEISLIFMDLVMPVMSGIEATRAIRKLPGVISKVPIIAMTAEAYPEKVRECFAAGMNGHIAKPVDQNILLQELRRVRSGVLDNTPIIVDIRETVQQDHPAGTGSG
ncbi:MAG: response regulator [Clostridia bacterium]|nr:response regulator [Clostridia bacterium]